MDWDWDDVTWVWKRLKVIGGVHVEEGNDGTWTVPVCADRIESSADILLKLL